MIRAGNAESTRRGFLASAGLAATAAWLKPRFAFAQNPADGGLVGQMRREAVSAKLDVQKLRGGVNVLIGSGGNIGVLPGRDGKFLVDAGLTGSRPQIGRALGEISADPIKLLANTHWHFDHTDGNEWLHSAGAIILAHENTRKHLSTSTRVADWDFTFPPSPDGALPVLDVKTQITLHLNGQQIDVEYYGPAHTDGDLSVHFRNADILHTGDTWWNGHFPFLDYSTGGSINGMIRAVDTNLAKTGPKTIIIPGHGPVGDESQLSEFREMLIAVRNNVSALKKQGKSIAEVLAAKPTAAYDAKWGTFVINGDFFTRLAYAGV